METKKKDEQPAEIQKVEPQQMQRVEIPADAPLMTRLAMMIERGIKVDVDQMGKMQEMAEQFEANEARKAYATAFAAAQADIGGVVKTRKNKQTNSMYAGLDDVIEMSKTVCEKHGFSITFNEGVTEVAGHIQLCATVLHKDGHKEPYHYNVPLGGVGIKGVVNMTAIHAKATSVSYGQRYLLCMIWNIPTKDTDGNGGRNNKPVEIPKPNEKEAAVIQLVCDDLPQQEGYVVSPKKIGALFYASLQEYPSNPNTVKDISKWLLDNYQNSQIYDDVSNAEIPGQFEQ